MKKQRYQIILKALKDHGNITIKNLSILCDSSYRTIQNDLNDLNKCFKKMNLKTRILTKPRVGLCFEPFNEEDLNILNEQLKICEPSKLTMNKNQLKITFTLLNNSYTKVDDLIDQYYYSKNSMTDILNEIRSDFKEYNIELITKPHYGMYVKGLESDIRKYMFHKLATLSDTEREELLGYQKNYFTELDERVIVAVKNYQLSMTDTIIEQLFLYIHIVCLRIRESHFGEKPNKEFNRNSFEYGFSEKIILEIAAFLKKDCHTNEIEQLVEFAEGKIRKKINNSTKRTDELVSNIIEDVMDLIYEKYGYEFAHDITLFTSLSIHFESLLKRADNDSFSINVIKDEIKTLYPLAFDIAIDIARLLNKKYEINIDEDETSYIAVYIHLAIERSKRANPYRKRILVVCPAGKGISQLIAHNIQTQFRDYISTIDTCGYYDLEDVEFTKYDYIFTNKSIHGNIPIPVIEMPLLSTKLDVARVKRKMAGKSERPALLELTTPELFISNLQAKNRDDALTQMIEHVNKMIELKPNFKEAVDLREKEYPTELGNGYAFPHPLMQDAANKSFLAFAILEKPIVWKTKKVHVILLGYIKTKESIKLQHFYRSFARFVTTKDYVPRLVNKPEYSVLIEIANEIQKEI